MDPSQKVDWKFYNILLTKLKRKNHGVIGAILLIHSLLKQEKLEQDSAWYYGTFPGEIIPAFHSMAIHNLKLRNTIIKFNEYLHASAHDWILQPILSTYCNDFRTSIARGVAM